MNKGLLIFCWLLLNTLFAMGLKKPKAPSPPGSLTHNFCATIGISHVIVTPADCNVSNGSIVDLVGSATAGTLSWTWYDEQNNVVGTTADLNNVKSGRYHVTLSDGTNCRPDTASFFIPVNNTISFNNNSAVITSPTCNGADGSITNITVNGSPTTFSWVAANNTGKVIATQKDLIGAGIGTYMLTAANSAGCENTSTYTINPGNYAPIASTTTITDADCKSSGSFTAIFGNIKSTDPVYSYALYNSASKTIASGSIAYQIGAATILKQNGLAADTYQLNTTGNGCTTNLATFTIKTSVFEIDTDGVRIHADACGHNSGTISNLSLKGTTPIDPADPNPNHGYFWLDVNDKRVGSASTLSNVPSGFYKLYVVNGDDCVSNTVKFFIPDSGITAAPPLLNDLKMCQPGIATLNVLNKDPKALYRLYDSAQNLVDTKRTGVFNRRVNATTAFYVQAVYGQCGGSASSVMVTVVNAGLTIPNAFTPNRDGVNDLWTITGLEKYPRAEISVFSRLGQRVYHSINYSKPFNGQYNGNDLPNGVYYYIVDTKSVDCGGGLSGSLTIIR